MCEFEKYDYLIKQVYNTFYKKYSFIKDDILQSGNIGLWKAMCTYDTNKNAKFETYAVACIKNEIRMLLKREMRFYGKVEEINNLEMIEAKPDTEQDEERQFQTLQSAMLDIVNDKEIFKMFCDGYKQVDIANKLGLSQYVVHKRLHRDLSLIKKHCLGEESERRKDIENCKEKGRERTQDR